VNHVDVEFVRSLPLNLIVRSDFILKVISKCYKLCLKYFDFPWWQADRRFDCAACPHHFRRLGRY